MIGEIYFNNYRLFKNENSISFIADLRTKKLLSNTVEVDGKSILKSIGLYGANNSGKTNIMDLIKNLKIVLSGGDNFVFNREVFNDDGLCDIAITFNNLDNSGWLKYEFSYSSKELKFIREKISEIKYYDGSTKIESVIFEKDLNNKIFQIYDDNFSEYLDVIPSRLPTLYSIELDEKGKFSNALSLRDALKKCSDNIELIQMFNIPIQKTIETLKGTNEEKKKFILSFVKDADLSIDGFSYSKDIKIVDNNNKPIEEKSLLEFYDTVDMLHLTTKYGDKQVPSLLYDSSGTKKIEAIASYIYEAISMGKTLIVDELDNGLHYRLTRAIVSAFNSIANTKGQILFSAHDLQLIASKNLLRKDQIYFLERKIEYAKVICLKEMTVATGGPRNETELLKKYNHGDFVNLPKPEFIRDILKINQ